MAPNKLDRPPYVHNWVRYNHPDQDKTTKALVAFAISMPRITYVAGATIIRDRIALKLDRETGLRAAQSRGHKKSRPYVTEFVTAFYDYDETRNYSGLPSYDEYVAPYHISRDIRVPVKPLIVISENGVLKPIFVVGWASMPLTRFQRRLLMIVLEDAVFSLTDFQQSPGEFVCFPRLEGTNSGARSSEVWHRGDYESLSHAELKEQIEIYLAALTQAKAILADRPATADDLHKNETSVADPRQTEMDI